MRGQISIFDGTPNSKYEKALELIHAFAAIAIKRNPLGYVVCDSGGKDSTVLVDLFLKAKERWGDEIKFIVIHNHTTLDAPETVYFIRHKFAKLREQGIDCRIYMPNVSFWRLCKNKKMLPTRIARFCCSELKERNDIPELKYAIHAFGVRKSESVRRAAHRDSIETRNTESYGTKSDQRFHFDKSDDVRQTSACYTNKYFIINPLAYWDNDDVWNHIDKYKLDYNPLYDMGFTRVGCIGCPMAGKHRQEEFERYPKYEDLFRKLCDEIYASWERDGKQDVTVCDGGGTSVGGSKTIKSADELFDFFKKQ